MFIFRPICGGIKESMANAVKFNTLGEMLDYMVKKYDNSFTREDLSLRWYCFDDRIGWDTWLISTKRFKNHDYIHEYGQSMAAGWCTFD